MSAVLVHYLHQWRCWEQVKVHVEPQDSQRDGGDVVQTHLEHLGGQEQQAQVGSPLSVSHTENSLRRDNGSVVVPCLKSILKPTRWL